MVDSIQASRHAEAMDTSSPSGRRCSFLQRVPVCEGSCKIGCQFGRRRSNWRERVPKCFAELGDRRSEVVAEFEVDQLPSVFSAL